MVVIADGYAQLVAHVLAHVNLASDRPGNVYDPRYVAWSRAQLDASTQAMLEHDATLIGARWRAEPRLDVLHELFVLHHDQHGFRRTATRSLAQLDACEVADPDLLARMLASPGAPVIELLHACLALLDDAFARALAPCAPVIERARAEVQACAARLAPVVPELAAARVELVWALGMHGRALAEFDSAASSRVMIGAPAPWNGLAPARQAVLAAHEQLVAGSGERDYLGQEWAALTKLARRMATLDDDAMREAHATWLAQLEFCGVLDGVAARGWVSQSMCARLLDHPDDRARLLAGRDLHRGPNRMQG